MLGILTGLSLVYLVSPHAMAAFRRSVSVGQGESVTVPRLLPAWVPANAPLLMLVDVVIWAVSLALAHGAFELLGVPPVFDGGRATATILAAQVGLGLVIGTYRWRWRLGTFREVGASAMVTGVVGLCAVGYYAAAANRRRR